MSEKNSESQGPPSGDDLDAEELLAATQANISNELAKKIWSVTSGDVALGIREFPSEKMPYVPSDFGSLLEAPTVSGSGYQNFNGLGSKQLANDNATAHILEVGRALYGETYGFPENDNPNYYKAAENYSLFGEYFLDFPKDTATCFADLEQAPAPDGDSKPPPEPERSTRSSLPYDRNPGPINGGAAAAAAPVPVPEPAAAASGAKYSGPSGATAPPQPQQRQVPPRPPQPPMPQRQSGEEMSINQMYQLNQLSQQAQMNHPHHQSCGHLHGTHVHAQPPPVGSAPQTPMATTLQQQPKQHRPVGALLSGAEIGGGGLCGHSHVCSHHAHNNATPNELNLTQLYQQLMARNMRSNPTQHQPHMVQNQPHHHHHTTTCAAAAAAMIYANFEQHIRQLQLQQQIQQQQQQQQRHARIPRGIYGGNGAQGGSGAPPGLGPGAGGVGGTPPTNKEPPANGHK